MKNNRIQLVENEINKVIAGKEDVIEKVLAAIFAGGHVLLEDVPGVGKTTMALAISKALSLDYKRIQFTPDVLPSDVVGFSMFNKKTNEFEYKEGAAMCNLLLADEINRTSPKTQAALLEVMEEGKVTVDGVTHFLPKPFFVIATQNPMGYVGTQKLPESQLDRFMVRLSMGYPDKTNELSIYNGKSNLLLDSVNKVIDRDDIIKMKEEVLGIRIDDRLLQYVVDFVDASRKNPYISLGISPRGGIALVNMSKSIAYIQGREYVIPEDIIVAIDCVTKHRIVLNSKAKANGLTEDNVIQTIRQELIIP